MVVPNKKPNPKLSRGRVTHQIVTAHVVFPSGEVSVERDAASSPSPTKRPSPKKGPSPKKSSTINKSPAPKKTGSRQAKAINDDEISSSSSSGSSSSSSSSSSSRSSSSASSSTSDDESSESSSSSSSSSSASSSSSFSSSSSSSQVEAVVVNDDEALASEKPQDGSKKAVPTGMPLFRNKKLLALLSNGGAPRFHSIKIPTPAERRKIEREMLVATAKKAAAAAQSHAALADHRDKMKQEDEMKKFVAEFLESERQRSASTNLNLDASRKPSPSPSASDGIKQGLDRLTAHFVWKNRTGLHQFQKAKRTLADLINHVKESGKIRPREAEEEQPSSNLANKKKNSVISNNDDNVEAINNKNDKKEGTINTNNNNNIKNNSNNNTDNIDLDDGAQEDSLNPEDNNNNNNNNDNAQKEECRSTADLLYLLLTNPGIVSDMEIQAEVNKVFQNRGCVSHGHHRNSACTGCSDFACILRWSDDDIPDDLDTWVRTHNVFLYDRIMNARRDLYENCERDAQNEFANPVDKQTKKKAKSKNTKKVQQDASVGGREFLNLLKEKIRAKQKSENKKKLGAEGARCFRCDASATATSMTAIYDRHNAPAGCKTTDSTINEATSGSSIATARDPTSFRCIHSTATIRRVKKLWMISRKKKKEATRKGGRPRKTKSAAAVADDAAAVAATNDDDAAESDSDESSDLNDPKYVISDRTPIDAAFFQQYLPPNTLGQAEMTVTINAFHSKNIRTWKDLNDTIPNLNLDDAFSNYNINGFVLQRLKKLCQKTFDALFQKGDSTTTVKKKKITKEKKKFNNNNKSKKAKKATPKKSSKPLPKKEGERKEKKKSEKKPQCKTSIPRYAPFSRMGRGKNRLQSVNPLVRWLFSIAKGMSFRHANEEAELGRNVARRWTQTLLDIVYAFEQRPFDGGGVARLAVDETYIGKRKYNRGRAPRFRFYWFVTLTELTKTGETGRTKWVPVKRRDESTLQNLIQSASLCTKRSVVISDCWRGYSNIGEALGVQHYTVNHNHDFVGEDGVHTNNCENSHKVTKQNVKKYFYNFGRDAARAQHVIALGTMFYGKNTWQKKLQALFVAIKECAFNEVKPISDKDLFQTKKFPTARVVANKNGFINGLPISLRWEDLKEDFEEMEQFKKSSSYTFNNLQQHLRQRLDYFIDDEDRNFLVFSGLDLSERKYLHGLVGNRFFSLSTISSTYLVRRPKPQSSGQANNGDVSAENSNLVGANLVSTANDDGRASSPLLPSDEHILVPVVVVAKKSFIKELPSPNDENSIFAYVGRGDGNDKSSSSSSDSDSSSSSSDDDKQKQAAAPATKKKKVGRKEGGRNDPRYVDGLFVGDLDDLVEKGNDSDSDEGNDELAHAELSRLLSECFEHDKHPADNRRVIQGDDLPTPPAAKWLDRVLTLGECSAHTIFPDHLNNWVEMGTPGKCVDFPAVSVMVALIRGMPCVPHDQLILGPENVMSFAENPRLQHHIRSRIQQPNNNNLPPLSRVRGVIFEDVSATPDAKLHKAKGAHFLCFDWDPATPEKLTLFESLGKRHHYKWSTAFHQQLCAAIGQPNIDRELDVKTDIQSIFRKQASNDCYLASTNKLIHLLTGREGFTTRERVAKLLVKFLVQGAGEAEVFAENLKKVMFRVKA